MDRVDWNSGLVTARVDLNGEGGAGYFCSENKQDFNIDISPWNKRDFNIDISPWNKRDFNIDMSPWNKRDFNIDMSPWLDTRR